MMLNDMASQDGIYRPGPYWQEYSKRIAAAIQAEGLASFRSSLGIAKGYADVFSDFSLPLMAPGWKRSVLSQFERSPATRSIVENYGRRISRRNREAHRRKALRFRNALGEWLQDFVTRYPVPPTRVGDPQRTVEFSGGTFGELYLRDFAWISEYSSRFDFRKIEVACEIGGGFGSKIYLYAEDVVVTWASRQIGRPVKWTADRSESFVSDAHGRDHHTIAETAMDKDGKFIGMRVHTTANIGAYLSTFASCVPTILYATLLAGQYTTPLIFCQVTAVFTNTAPVDAYRGAGRPEATYVVERLVETAAREMKLDPAEIRRRNFIREFPYQTPVALQYDTGNYEATLDAAMKMADVAGFAKRKEEAAKRGKLRGLGYAAYIEACGIAPSAVAGSLGARAGLFEAGEIRVHPTGSVTVFTGSHSHGQGHETTFAQVVADRLGMAVENVDIVHGDTSKILFGMGTYGSRSIAVGGTAIVKAVDKIVAKGKKIAAHLLEASEADIEFKDGVFRIAGSDRQVPFAGVSLAAYVPHNYPHDDLEPGLNETSFYDPANFTYPNGCHICEVEIDPETGLWRWASAKEGLHRTLPEFFEKRREDYAPE